jgi:hypothetical protein
MKNRDEDLKTLNAILTYADEQEDDEKVSEKEADAFRSMHQLLVEGFREELTEKQRKWARGVAARIRGEEAEPEYENLISNGLCPRGREVPTPAVLQNLPKRPPPRRASNG